MNLLTITKTQSNHYPTLFYHLIIISAIIIVATATPNNDLYEKSRKYFPTLEADSGKNDMNPDEYFDMDKRSGNLYSWMNNKNIRSSPRDFLMTQDKPGPLNPYSWQYLVKKKSQKFSRNPYSWMNN
uniref:Uncharacterized protein n=1 Tax=Setaria digitata TaxID=48799 RepID=A0A915Q2B0_9BILA